MSPLRIEVLDGAVVLLLLGVSVAEGEMVKRRPDQEARRGGYDLIVVGSVTERVIRRVWVPVLVVPVHHDGCED